MYPKHKYQINETLKDDKGQVIGIVDGIRFGKNGEVFYDVRAEGEEHKIFPKDAKAKESGKPEKARLKG